MTERRNIMMTTLFCQHSDFNSKIQFRSVQAGFHRRCTEFGAQIIFRISVILVLVGLSIFLSGCVRDADLVKAIGGNSIPTHVLELYSQSNVSQAEQERISQSIGTPQLIVAKIFQGELAEADELLKYGDEYYGRQGLNLSNATIETVISTFGISHGGPMSSFLMSPSGSGTPTKAENPLTKFKVVNSAGNIAVSDASGVILISRGLLKAIAKEIVMNITNSSPQAYLANSVAIYRGEVNAERLSDVKPVTLKDMTVKVDPKSGQQVYNLLGAFASRGGASKKWTTIVEMTTQVRSVVEFVIMHEIAHVKLGHNLKNRTCKELIQHEYDADAWAATYLIYNYGINVMGHLDVFANMTGYNAFFQYQNNIVFGDKDFSGKCKYPDPVERMNRLQNLQKQLVNKRGFPMNPAVIGL